MCVATNGLIPDFDAEEIYHYGIDTFSEVRSVLRKLDKFRIYREEYYLEVSVAVALSLRNELNITEDQKILGVLWKTEPSLQGRSINIVKH